MYRTASSTSPRIHLHLHHQRIFTFLSSFSFSSSPNPTTAMPSTTSHHRRRSSLTTTLTAILCLSLAACTVPTAQALPTGHLPLPALRHYQQQVATQPAYVPKQSEEIATKTSPEEDDIEDEETKHVEAMARSRIMMRRRRVHP